MFSGYCLWLLLFGNSGRLTEIFIFQISVHYLLKNITETHEVPNLFVKRIIFYVIQNVMHQLYAAINKLKLLTFFD
jgi:hypothetical protein